MKIEDDDRLLREVFVCDNEACVLCGSSQMFPFSSSVVRCDECGKKLRYLHTESIEEANFFERRKRKKRSQEPSVAAQEPIPATFHALSLPSPSPNQKPL